MQQLLLKAHTGETKQRQHPALALTSTVATLLADGAPVAIGVSGGKDSSATALATCTYLDTIGHTGPRVLIHSDLGRVEWRASLPMCERLAARLGLPLLVVRREAGDLLTRWQVRWQRNLERYRQLACVKLILPWSTASMRFCTSELKTALICRELVQRFPGRTILSVSGIRREESLARAKAAICQPQPRLLNRTHHTDGLDWHPLLDWTRAEVLAYHQTRNFPLHEAYTVYGSSRVSCAFCILSSQADLHAAATCVKNQTLYREMVELEIASTFRFQDRWLGDAAPDLLDGTMREALRDAKVRAAQREAAEARLPDHLLYTKGWPTALPTKAEARLLSEVRQSVAEAVGISDMQYLDAEAIRDRYADLLAANTARNPIESLPASEPLLLRSSLWETPYGEEVLL